MISHVFVGTSTRCDRCFGPREDHVIKLTGTHGKTGKPFVLLGLSRGNLRKMEQGQPLHIFGAEIGIDADIVIITGETEDDLAKQVSPLLQPATQVTDRRDEKKN